MSERILRTSLLLFLVSAVSVGEVVEVGFPVEVRAQLDLRDRHSVTIAPFLFAHEEGESSAEIRGVDLQDEFERYLGRVLRRRTQLEFVPPFLIDYPTRDPIALARDQDFWRAVGERLGVDLILTGSLDFDVHHRSGYTIEPYEHNGQRYERQVLIEQTGFEFDILLEVFDGRTGELLFTDHLKDFKQFEDGGDPVAGMLTNLAGLEDRIAGIFAKRTVHTARVLLTD